MTDLPKTTPHPSRSTRKARRARSGAAMLEAALVVPVLGTALLGTVMLQRFYIEGQRATENARRCAWMHAMAGCPDEPPAGCGGNLSSGDKAAGSEQSSQLRGLAQTESGGGVLSEVPLLGDAVDALFGTTASAHAEREIPVAGEERKLKARGDIAVLCNTRPVDIGAAIKKIFCKAVTFGACGG